jgi:hypothetical protein
MSDIDDKLREIFAQHRMNAQEYDKETLDTECIKLIKQAFADDGYVKNGNIGHTINGVVVMQGQEWLSRFNRILREHDRVELDTKQGTTDFIALPIIEEAAKRAAKIARDYSIELPPATHRPSDHYREKA